MSTTHESEKVIPLKKEPAKRGKRAGVEVFPRLSLKKSLVIPEAVWKQNGGNPFNILDLAPATNWSPNSSGFITLLASSYRYGLTEGSLQTKVISLKPLGMSIVAPKEDTNEKEALKKALLHNPLFEKVYLHFDGKPIPRDEVLKNTLIRTPEAGGFGIAREDVDSFMQVLMENISDFGLEQDIGGTKYLRLDKLDNGPSASTTLADIEIPGPTQAAETASEDAIETKTDEIKIPKQIFVAHGKNKKPLEQLKGILDQFQVSSKVAVDEPHEGRPISQKVSDIMRECSSAIFIFTKDEETKDVEGNTVYRPSDNVVYELGAASILYGKKIVIFKEEGVTFGTDFKDLGYISFETDKLNAKTMELMKELVRFNILKVSAA